MTPQVDGPEFDAAVRPEQLTLSAEQQRLLDAVWEQVEPETLRELVSTITSIPSPTGNERVLAEFIAETLAASGLRGQVQLLDESQANAIGVLEGGSSHPSLLLYAPIDTLTSGRLEDDEAGIGPELRADMLPTAFSEGDYVIGLGAANPKGHAAAVVAAAKAIGEAGIPLCGELIVGLGAGGMPTNADPRMPGRRNVGHGVGCSFMLEQGVRTDFAVIAKPGPAVEWEEVGLCWFQVDVLGTHGYVGSRHRMEHRNAIIDAAYVVQELDRWFQSYTAQHTNGLVAPQGSIGAIEAGWPHKPSFTPHASRIHLDLRISPRTDPLEAKREFAQALADIVDKRPGVRVEWKTTLAIPGSRTPPSTPIVQSCLRAWEYVRGVPHRSVSGTSGATDANILRRRGVPTARVGMPKPVGAPVSVPEDFPMGMNVVSIPALEELTKMLTYAAIDTCARC